MLLLLYFRGEPDNPNYDGATAVHLAASCGQLNCLSFLTNFGCNIWALNNDGRTPLEDGAYHGRMDCVRHLDGLIAIQMLHNKKQVEKQKLHAKREAIKRVKKQSKLQQERDKAYERRVNDELQNKYDQLGDDTMGESNGNWGTKSTRSMYNERTFSQLASNRGFNDSDFEAKGVPAHNWSDTFSQRSRLFGALRGKINSTLRKKSPNDGRGALTKRTSLSQPELYHEKPSHNSKSFEDLSHESSQIRVRTKSLSSESDNDNDQESTPSIGHIVKKYDDKGNVSTEIHYDQSQSSNSKNGVRRGSHGSQKSFTSHELASLQSAGFEEHNDHAEIEVSNEMKAVVTFLTGLNLEQFATPFLKESIDLSALMLCDDKDLQELNLPLGPRRKILEAVKRRKMALEKPGVMADSKI